MPEQDIADELWDLALNTPAKHFYMYIVDEVSGTEFRVDQTFDCRMNGPPDVMERVLLTLAGIEPKFSDNTYKELFGDAEMKDLRIDKIYIRFEGISGEKAYVLLARFCRTLKDSLLKAGVLKWEQGTERKE